MERVIKQFRVQPGQKVNLADFDTGESLDFKKKDSDRYLKEFQEQMSALQERMYAEDRQSLLLVFQAMDAAGKDSAIKHVMSGINPQGCQVFSFKQPSSEDYEHNFLWRHSKAMPERGRIGIHNRSHYEYVLVCKVHPEYIMKERIPQVVNVEDVGPDFWEKRYETIRDFEKALHTSGTKVLKFFLHVSEEEQKKRFLERINDESKNWKFSSGDLAERELWNDYMKVYEEAMEATSTEDSPWYISPADKKWFTRIAVGKIIVEALKELNPQYPTLPERERENLEEYREWLTKDSLN
jgi:PPK2 family polyphosphate:nucleotide phosphotransferase